MKCPTCHVGFASGWLMCPADKVALESEHHHSPEERCEPRLPPDEGATKLARPLPDATKADSDDLAATRAEMPTKVELPATSPADDSLAPGIEIEGFKVLRQLGKGGMGSVYEAIHGVIHKRAAIKVLHAEQARRPTVLRRFTLEAQSVNRTYCDQIVDVFAIGALEDGRPFLIMDYIEGRSLLEVLREHRGGLPFPMLWPIALDVASGLLAAHDCGVVHRDLKPANIMVIVDERTQRISAKVVDFGVARLLDDDENSELDVAGTPPYMAPEVLDGGGDHRLDIFAFGVTLYIALSGKMPIGVRTLGELAQHYLEGRPVTPLATHRADLPEDVSGLIERCMDPIIEERPKTMREVLDEVLRLAAAYHEARGVVR